METAALAFGTLGFWLFASVVVIAMLTCINFQKGFGATVVAVGTILAFQFFGGYDIFGYVRHNPMSLLSYVGIYAALGVGTGIFKWWRYVRNHRAKYLEAKTEYQDDKGTLDGWEKYREAGNYSAIKFIFQPVARKHKAVITMWMTYWPLVLVWTVINDPVRKFFRAVYERVSGLLEAISHNAFKDVDNDLPTQKRRSKVGSFDDNE
jgi:hypothetical protein